MKRIIMLLIVVMFGIGLVGCGNINNQIKKDYLNYAHLNGENDLTIDDVKILENYGEFEDTIIVLMNRNAYQIVTKLMIDGVELAFSDSNTALVYKKGDFYELEDAYDKGVISKDSLLKLQSIINKNI